MYSMDKIYLEIERIKQQVESTKACAEDTYLLKSNVAMVETHIKQSLTSLNNLLQGIHDYQNNGIDIDMPNFITKDTQ